MIISYETLKTLFKCSLPLEKLTTLLTAQGLEVEGVYHNPSLEHFITAQVSQRVDNGYIMRTAEQEMLVVTVESLERDVHYVLNNLSGNWALTTPETLKWSSVKKPLTVPGGLSIATAWEWHDVLIELSVTPNRGDCLSYLGIVREIFLALRQPFDHLHWVAQMKQRYPVSFEDTTQLCVDIEQGIARHYSLMQVSCPRFESPFWLQRFLLKHGYQPKLPGVDVGHYWMLLLGLPSHAFDAAAFNGRVCLKYHHFEQPYTWQGIQGPPIQLTGTLPVMMDEHGHILCIPGAMGSAESASTEHSQRLVIEAAAFLPKAIRPMRACVPVTPSSLRFERGVWRFGQEDLMELIGGLLCSFHPQVRCSQPLLSYQKEWEAPVLSTTRQRLEKLTGRSFDAEELANLLVLMGAHVDGDRYDLSVPSWRFDLKIEQNFIGEIVRCYGIDSIREEKRFAPSRPRTAQLSRKAIDPWISLGAQEVVTYSFVPKAWAYSSGPTACDSEGCYVVQNPISEDLSVMRPSLLPSLCDLLSYHQRHQLDLVPLVELAPTYHKSWALGQRLRLSVVWPQKNSIRCWRGLQKEVSFYDIKAHIERILPEGITFEPGQAASDTDKLYHPQLQAQISYQGRIIGSFGLLSPRACQQFDWPSAWLIDIDADFFEKPQALNSYRSFSKRPFVTRDWVFFVPENITAESLVQRVQSYDWPLCQSVRVFDFYIDQSGQRSIGLEVRFQAADRTLTDQDLQPLHQHIIADLTEHFGAKLKD